MAQDAATEFERARLAYADSDYVTAREAAIAAAQAGNAEAMTLAGLLMERGQGGAASDPGARDWYEQAAAQNQPDALMALARLAMEARAGLAPADARTWLRRAQERDAEGAGLALGRMLAQGVGGPPDPIAARAVLQTEADKGDPAAIRELALLDLDEGGVDTALGGLERAAALGDADAAYAAGALIADDLGATDADMARAVRLFRQAAEAGHPAASTLYAHALYQGAGAAQDRDAAVGWYRMAAEAGDPEGQFYYAVMLFAGAGVAADAEQSYYWVLRSALADLEPAAGYGPQRDALRAQAEAALDGDARDAGRARAQADAD